MPAHRYEEVSKCHTSGESEESQVTKYVNEGIYLETQDIVTVVPEQLSSRTSFQLEDEVLYISDS